MSSTKKTLRRRRGELKRRSEQSRRNKNRSRRQALQESVQRPILENILGITAAQGYTNVLATGASLSKRSASNYNTQMMVKKMKQKDINGNTRLHLATTDDEVRRLVAIGLDINERNNNGETPLHVLLRAHIIPATKLMDDMQWDINLLESSKDSILLYIQLGADLEAADNQGIKVSTLIWRAKHWIPTYIAAENELFERITENEYYEIHRYLSNELEQLENLPETQERVLEKENLSVSIGLLNLTIRNEMNNNALNNIFVDEGVMENL